jgi:hypothetical protein
LEFVDVVELPVLGWIHPVNDDVTADVTERHPSKRLLPHLATTRRPEDTAVVATTAFVDADDVGKRGNAEGSNES